MKISLKTTRSYLFVPLFALLLSALLLSVVGCKSKDSKMEPTDNVIAANDDAEGESDNKAPNFALISPQQPVFVDKKNKVTLEIQPRNGLKINHEFPWKVKFLSKNNIQVQEQELTKDQIDMDDKRVRITIDVTPTNEGTLDLEGVGTFSVCSKKLCDIRRDEPLRFTLVAEPEA